MDAPVEVLPPYLRGADRTIFGQMPALMVPVVGELPECAVGQRRILLASDGLYVEARTPSLHVRAPISDVALPFGDTRPHCRLVGGLMPAALGRALVDAAIAASPKETAMLVIYRPSLGRYALHHPALDSASSAHVTLEHWSDQDDQHLAVDVHTHGDIAPYFSATDDASDRSIHEPHISLVFGHCREGGIAVAGRICVGHHLVPLADVGLAPGDLFEALPAKDQ